VPLPTSTTASPSFGDALVKAHSRNRMMPAALSWWSNRRSCGASASAPAPSSVGRLKSHVGIDSSDETSSSDDMTISVTPSRRSTRRARATGLESSPATPRATIEPWATGAGGGLASALDASARLRSLLVARDVRAICWPDARIGVVLARGALVWAEDSVSAVGDA
jgi:hypothetical protein